MNYEFIKFFLLFTWILMYVVWGFSDPRSFKQRIKEYLSLRPLLYAIVSFSVIAMSVFWSDKFLIISSLNSLTTYIGLGIFLLGLFIAVWSKFTMKAIWGIPGQHDRNKQNQVITNGPFRFSRNPIYLGLIIMFFGFFISLQSYLIIFAFLGAYYFYKMAIIEEKLLIKYFGKEYMEYKEQVPLFI